MKETEKEIKLELASSEGIEGEAPKIVRATVDGRSIEFSSNVGLSNSYEALLTFFALPAMKSARAMTLPPGATVSRTWRENVREASTIIEKWWGFHPLLIDAALREENIAAVEAGLFFTGGVDSSYSLVINRGKVSRLINIEGFDVSIRDSARLAATASLVNHIADQESLEVIRVRTDIRDHPLFGSVEWGKTHGSALAGVAHLLAPHLRRVLIASSDVRSPHGSHPLLDPMWSSRAVSLVYDSPGVSRLEKV